jgi:Tfp pilus assembly protein PilF
MVPRVSIITPWLDHPEFIADYEKAVDAPGVEVIIVDNGSARANAIALRSMVDRLGGKYIRNEENRWFSAANNQGLAVASGDIILFANNDISATVGWLDDVHRDVKEGALFGPTMRSDRVDEWIIEYIEGSCIAATRAVWERLGAWNERAFQMNHAEDLELCVRATRAGLALVKTAWSFHHKGGGTGPMVPGAYAGAMHNGRVLRQLLRGQSAESGRGSTVRSPSAPLPPQSYVDSGCLPDGERDYQRALKNEPGRPDLWMNYGVVLRLSGRFEAAAQAFGRATTLDKRLEPLAYSEMGIAWTNAERHEQAIEAFSQAVRLLPRSTPALCNLSEALARAGRTADAAQVARTALQVEPQSVAAHIRLALALAAAGDSTGAIAAAQRAATLDPKHVHAHYALARAYHAASDVNGMLAAYNQAATLDPTDVAVRHFRDTVLRKLEGP